MTDPQILLVLGYNPVRVQGYVEQESDGVKVWYKDRYDSIVINRTRFMGTYVWQVSPTQNRIWTLLPESPEAARLSRELLRVHKRPK